MAQRVLIVEDDPDIAITLQEIIGLEAPQFETVIAHDGKEGERILSQDPMPCLVFLDLHMPRMNGDEFLSRKWANLETRDVPVVVMTATNEQREGVDHVTRTIHKPFELVAILRQIEKHCE